MPEQQQNDKIYFSIDGKQVEGKKGESVIAVADRYGIYIPRFCYHEKLSVVANCRMCLVEIAKAPKTLPACATQIMPDMQVFTKSKATVASQRAIMEFLLVNHPLDCPICDKGGECELQDLAMGFGHTESKFHEPKRSVDDENLGPLIATDMTRCIHCTRCIRFGTEIAGIPELGATGRGEDMRIETYLERGLHSELSGNCIDVCPVGALTSRPFRYRGRSWGFNQHIAYASHDCVGSNQYIQTINKGYENKTEIMRVLPKKNESLNQTWLSDRDRFSYLGLRHSDRLTQPKLKRNGIWQTISWEEALNEVADRTIKTIKEHGAKECGFLLSPSTTNEEGYLLTKIAKQLKCPNIDYRIYASGGQKEINPNTFSTIEDLSSLSSKKTILLLGSYIRHEQPVASIRVREASLAGADIFSINPKHYDWNFPICESIQVAHDNMLHFCAQVLVSACKIKKLPIDDTWKNLLKKIRSTPKSDALAEKISENSSCIIVGEYAQSLHNADLLIEIINYISRITGTDKLLMTPGCNARGLHMIGAIPDQKDAKTSGLDCHALLEKPKKMLWIHQFEPEFDIFNPKRAITALKNSDTVVCFTPFETKAMREYANILLPITPPSEMSGTYINAMGQMQSFQASQEHLGDSKPGWKCLRVLGTLLGLEGFVFRAIDELQQEINTSLVREMPDTLPDMNQLDWQKEPVQKSLVHRIGIKPIYRVDGIVRRADALQQASAVQKMVVRMHSKTAKAFKVDQRIKLRLRMEKKSFCFPFKIDDNVCEGCIDIPTALVESRELGGTSDWVEILA